jgi:uncharacterized protein
MATSVDFGLPLRTLDLMRSVLASHAGIHRALVYGSRAKGNFRVGSDIDLTLDAPELTLSDLLCISGELDELMLPYTIDLSLLQHIKNPGLLRHIERVGKLL